MVSFSYVATVSITIHLDEAMVVKKCIVKEEKLLFLVLRQFRG